MSEFRKDIAAAINKHNAESGSNTPDFILAEYIADCLAAFDKTSRARERWFGTELRIGAQADEHVAFNTDGGQGAKP